jgi:hypothetical protein
MDNTLAALTLIKLFVEMLKISKNKNKFKEQSFVEESRESIEIIFFSRHEIFKFN